MTNPYQAMRAELIVKRDALQAAIVALSALIGDEPTPDTQALRPAPRLARRHRLGPKRALKRTDGRTDGRSKSRATAAARRVSGDTHSEAIVTALRAKSPQAPSELAKHLKLNPAALRYQLKPLLASGAVIATGATMNRQITLPPRASAAKEGH